MSVTLSYTRARVFDECPAKYKAQYIDDRLPKSQDWYLILGSVVHEMLDRYVQHLKTARQPSDFKRMETIFEEVWASQHRDGLAESYREDAANLVETAIRNLIFAKPEVIAASEARLAVDRDWKPVDYDAPEAFLRGRIDRLDIGDEGDALVVDYKTGFKMESIESSKQMPLYGLLVMANFPMVRTVDVELLYLRYEKSKVGRMGEIDFERIKAWVVGIANGIERATASGSWPATPGAACRTCAAFKDCEARKHSGAILPPQDEAAAADLMARLILVEREWGELRSALQAWVDQYGAVEVNGMWLGYTVKNRLQFDTLRVIGLLEKRGLRPNDYLRVDTVMIKKLGRRDRMLAKELEDCSTDASTTELKLSVQGE